MKPPVSAEVVDCLYRGCRLRCLLFPYTMLGFSSGKNLDIKATYRRILMMSLDIHVPAWPTSV